jgi:hypothetical protein
MGFNEVGSPVAGVLMSSRPEVEPIVPAPAGVIGDRLKFMAILWDDPAGSASRSR